MKRSVPAFLILFLFFAPGSHAQKLPADSPKEVLVSRIGLSKMVVEYGRPGVKGRRIFGGIVPFDQVWRTGANYPTFLSIADSLTIEGKYVLPPAKYALYTIPGRSKWTFIFSKDTTLWGAFGYKKENDVLRVDVAPDTANRFTETFTVTLSNIVYESATLNLEWERTRVPLNISFNHYLKVINYVGEAARDTFKSRDWSIYWQGAKYLMQKNQDPETAMKWLDKSISLEENYMNLWSKAELLASQGDYKKAIKYGNKALEKGKLTPVGFDYAAWYADTLAEWQKKTK